MAWIYSENNVSVIIGDNRSIIYNNYNLLMHDISKNKHKILIDKLLPFIIKPNTNSWIYEILHSQLDDWIVENLTGWWCYSDNFTYRFQKEDDAVMFKLRWG